MNQINFIPESFLRTKSRRRTWTQSALLVLVGVLMMGGWRAHTQKQIAALESELGALKQKEGLARARSLNRRTLEAKNRTPSKQAMIVDRVKPPVPTTAIIALVAQWMPRSMGLTSLSLMGEPPKPLPPQTKRRRATFSKQPPTTPLHLAMEGVAPHDLSIAQFIQQLDRHVMFEHVELVYTRAVDRGELMARQFQVTVEVPTDRVYVLTDLQDEPNEQ